MGWGSPNPPDFVSDAFYFLLMEIVVNMQQSDQQKMYPQILENVDVEGTFYFDIFPRENYQKKKYPQFSMF